jgi:hypothetical protein
VFSYASYFEKMFRNKVLCKKVGGEYLSEGTRKVGVALGTAAGSAVVTTALGVGGAIIGSAAKCVMSPPKTYVGVSLCVGGWYIAFNIFRSSYICSSVLCQFGWHQFLWRFKTLTIKLEYILKIT